MSKITGKIVTILNHRHHYYKGDSAVLFNKDYPEAIRTTAKTIEHEILASLDPWIKVEDRLPEGDVKMDWLVKHPGMLVKISHNHTGGEMAIIMKAARYSKETIYQPITEPGNE